MESTKNDYPDFIETTGYGIDPLGLCGINCYHSFSAFIEGVSTRSYTDEELKRMHDADNEERSYGGKTYTRYEATQHMRRLERIMRAQRQRIRLLKAGGADKASLRAAQSKNRATQHEYASFAEAMNLKQQMERVGISRNVDSQRNGIERTLAKSSENDIIGVEKARRADSRIAISQERVDGVVNGALRGVRFTVPPKYNGRISDYGRTKCTVDGLGRKNVTEIVIGKQKNDSEQELIDTLLHEELEARILMRSNWSNYYKTLDEAADKTRHDFINMVIAKFLKLKGY